MTKPAQPVYDYKVAGIVRDVDGDTADVVVDVGFHMTTTQRFRFLNCDTPERHETGWAECSAYTTAWLTANLPVLRVGTTKTDDFGRYLGDFYANGVHLSDLLNELMATNGWTSPGNR